MQPKEFIVADKEPLLVGAPVRDRSLMDSGTWARYRDVYTLVAYLMHHSEMIDNIRLQHRRDTDGTCRARCGAYPCLLRCCAEEALRQPKRRVE
jgi:hypothetical protein